MDDLFLTDLWIMILAGIFAVLAFVADFLERRL